MTPQIGDIVTACSGGSWGKSARYDKPDRVMLNTSTLRLRFFNDSANNDYLYLITKSDIFKGQLKAQLSGMQPNFGYAHYSKILIPIPPISEQKRIVEKLEQILPLIDEYGKNEEKLAHLNETSPDKIKQSILQYAVQGKLVEQNSEDEPASELLKKIKIEKEQLIKEGKIKKDKKESFIYKGEDNNYYEQIGSETKCINDEIPFDIPDSWEWVRFGNIIKLTSGQDLTPDMYNADNRGIPYLTGASNIINEHIIINRWTENGRAFAYTGNLLITCKGTVGTMAILDKEKVHIARQIMAIEPFTNIDILYVKLFLNSYINNLKVCAKSIIPGISRDDVLNILFPFPSYSEQKRIVKKTNELINIVDKL